MYVIIAKVPDGETHKLISDRKKAIDLFMKEEEHFENHSEAETLVLAEVEEGVEYGFGSRGDFFGGKIIMEFMNP